MTLVAMLLICLPDTTQAVWLYLWVVAGVWMLSQGALSVAELGVLVAIDTGCQARGVLRGMW